MKGKNSISSKSSLNKERWRKNLKTRDQYTKRRRSVPTFKDNLFDLSRMATKEQVN